MFQFSKEETALEAARFLAVREATPILVVTRWPREVFSIGPRHSAALREAGRHVATVYWSGRVDYLGQA
jgi:hypothetical protein